MSRTPQVVASLILGSALCIVGVTLAGPLNPPAGPVAQTDPDLGQILAAVQGQTSDCCGNAKGEPGDPAIGQLNINGIGTSLVLEHSAGAFVPPGSNPSIEPITIVRVPDIQSAQLVEAMLTGALVDAQLQVGDGFGIIISFTRARITGIIHTQVTTCDGVRHAEELTFEPSGIIEYSGPNLSVEYNLMTGVVTTN